MGRQALPGCVQNTMLVWLFALAHAQHERLIESQVPSAPNWPNALDGDLPAKPQGCNPPVNSSSTNQTSWYDDDDNADDDAATGNGANGVPEWCLYRMRGGKISATGREQ